MKLDTKPVTRWILLIRNGPANDPQRSSGQIEMRRSRREHPGFELLHELLLLRDPATDTPYFLGVELEVDRDSGLLPADAAELRRGETTGGFPAEVAVYDPRSSELLAVARSILTGVLSGQVQLLEDLRSS